MTMQAIKKRLGVVGVAAGLLFAGAASADSFYTDEGAFLSATGPLLFESFESASGSGSSIDVGAFTVSDTNLSINSGTNTSTHHATDGTKYVYNNASSDSLTLTFDSLVDSVGFFLTDLFWTATGPELVITTDGGSVINTGITSQTSEAYLGLVADVSFSSLTVSFQNGDGVGLDSVSYGLMGGQEPVVDNQGGNDVVTHGVPTPTAGFAGLALLGALSFRRRIA